MSSAATIVLDEPAPLEAWEKWCRQVGAAYSPRTVGGNTWYLDDIALSFGKDSYQPRWQDNRPPATATVLRASTFYMGNVAGVARTAVDLWAAFDGSLSADPEVRASIRHQCPLMRPPT